MDDTIDLYSDRGELLEEDVPLEAISPVRNSAIKKTFSLAKRTIGVDLAGIDEDLNTGKVGGEAIQIKGRELDLNVTGNAEEIAEKIKEKLEVKPDDDTKVEILDEDGEDLLVTIPQDRSEGGVEYTTGLTSTAAAVTEAIIEVCGVDMFDANMVHAAVWGRYPQTVELAGSNLDALLDIPQRNEGLGFALRNVMVNDVVASTAKNAMQATALAFELEQGGAYEMGDAVGSFERTHLLSFAYGGLNADNLLYELVEENADGTVGDVVSSVVERALEDDVIEVAKTMDSGYDSYRTDDMPLWNAYATAGMIAAVMVNSGAMRASQAVPSTVLYYNDLLERETSLPGVDFGRAEGTSVGMSFFSHSIYGGGGPGIFKGNHIVTRHAKGSLIPAVAAACSLDAGTQMLGPEMTSPLKPETFGAFDEFNKPIQSIAEGAREVKEEMA